MYGMNLLHKTVFCFLTLGYHFANSMRSMSSNVFAYCFYKINLIYVDDCTNKFDGVSIKNFSLNTFSCSEAGTKSIKR